MSANVQFLGSYLSDGATASASGTATGYDPQSVVGIERSTGWLAPSTAAVRLILDLGSAKTPTGLGLVGGNWSAWGTTKLQHSTDGSTWVDFLTLSGLPADDLDYFAKLVSAPSRQYWALYWAAPSSAPGLAVFYLGTLTALPVNPDLNMAGGDRYNVSEEPAASGAVISEEFGRRTEVFSLAFSGITTSQFTTIRGLTRTEGGNKRPFFYVPRDDSGSGTQGQAHLVRGPREVPWTEEFGGVFNLTVNLREES